MPQMTDITLAGLGRHMASLTLTGAIGGTLWDLQVSVMQAEMEWVLTACQLGLSLGAKNDSECLKDGNLKQARRAE